MESVPEGSRVAAILHIDKYDANWKYGVRSIVDSAQYFAEVHVVRSEQLVKHGSFNKMMEALPLDPALHIGELNWDCVKSRAAMHFEPDMIVDPNTVRNQVEELRRESASNGRHVYFRTRTTTVLEEHGSSLSVLWYGFLVVMATIDAVRAFFHLTDYDKAFDLRTEMLNHTYEARVAQCHRGFSSLPYLSRAAWTKSIGMAVAQSVATEDAGLRYVFRTLHRHPSLQWGVWWISFWLYYGAFAVPFWRLFYASSFQAYFTAWTVAFYALNMALATGSVLNKIVVAPPIVLTLFILLYPLYLTLFPFLWLYEKLYTPNAKQKKRRN